jgi:cytokinin dehydrogenase
MMPPGFGWYDAGMADFASALQGRISGTVLADPSALAQGSADFGRLVDKRPAAVVRPASVEDVAAIVRFAGEAGIGVTCRGAAHSQSGQGLSAGGLLLDMTGLDGAIAVDVEAGTVTCLAGTSWSDIVTETMKHGLIPPVLTNNLNVTVGGTLSVAGIGVASFRYAAQVDTCVRLQVVTGTGEIVECDREHDRELFDTARGGLGLAGIITRATMRLRPFKPRTRTFFLLYDDLAALFRDERTLIEHGRQDYLESWCVPCPQGFREGPMGRQVFAEWFFPLHVTVEYDGEPPGESDVLEGLTPYRRPHVGDQATETFARRLEPLFDLWKRAGYWANTHPWMETILPWDSAPAYIGQVLVNLPPPALGGGHILLWPAKGRISDAPLFRTPDSELVVGFGILPGLPKELAAQATPRLTMASDMASMMGGKRYLSGYLNFDRPRWQAHYGDRFAWLMEMKGRFDPKGVLNPGLIPDA